MARSGDLHRGAAEKILFTLITWRAAIPCRAGPEMSARFLTQIRHQNVGEAAKLLESI
jgi:hypothetical protein